MNEDEVVRTLAAYGPSLASSLAANLQKDLNLTPAAARKRIQRAREQGLIFALEGLSLKNKEQFLFTGEQENTPSFRQTLFNSLAHSRYGTVLQGLSARGGKVPLHIFPSVSGLPILDVSAGVTASLALTQLSNWGLLTFDQSAAGRCVRFNDASTLPSDNLVRARILSEHLLLVALREWLQIQGFISGKTSSIRTVNLSDRPQFGFFQWDLVAPSYLSALRNYRDGQPVPGFVVADVHLGRQLSLDDVQYFTAKCSSIQNKPNSRPFIPFLIAERFDRDALLLGRKLGSVFSTPENLFGEQFSNSLSCLTELSEQNRSEQQLLEKILELLSNVDHLKNTVLELKKLAFAILLTKLLREAYASSAKTFMVLADSEDTMFQVDIILIDGGNLRVVKTDFSEGTLDIESMQSWFISTVPALHSIISKLAQYKKIKHFEYCFLSSCQLDDDAKDLFNSLIHASSCSYTLSLKDRSWLEQTLANSNAYLATIFRKLCSGPTPLSESDSIT